MKPTEITLGSIVQYGERKGRAYAVNPWFVSFRPVDDSRDLGEFFQRDFGDLILMGYKWVGPRPTHSTIEV